MDQESKRFEIDKLKLEQEFQWKKLVAEQELEKQKLDRQHSFDARREYARQILEYSLQYERHLKEYGQLALRTVFFLNGGAILALLTFIGSSIGKKVGMTAVSPSMFVCAFVFYSAGLVLTALSMTLAYLNYVGHHGSKSDPAALANNMIAQEKIWPGNFSQGNNRLISWTWYLALGFGISSLICFVAGCYQVSRAFAVLK